MIKPHEYLNLDTCLLHISSLILEELLSTGILKYDELYKRIKNKVKVEIDEEYIYAIDLLFLLGKISYDKRSDTLELIK